MGKTTLYDVTGVTVTIRDMIRNGVNIWDFDYPSYYKGEEKKAFEQKVIDHYYMREIGQETVGRFLHYFRSRIREIMPYYIQLYESEAIMKGIEDPFGNVDITETFEQTSTGSGSGNAGSDSENKYLNTPQGAVENIDDGYITNAEKNNSNSTNSFTNEGTVRHTFTKKGNQGVNTYAHDMVELRKTFLNIDMMIIDDLRNLFMGVY